MRESEILALLKVWEINTKMWTAIKTGSIKSIKYFYQHGLLKLDAGLCYQFAKDGHVECIQFIYEQGIVLSDYHFDILVAHGHIECLKYIHKNTTNVNMDRAFFTATKNGRLDCAMYAHQYLKKVDTMEITCKWIKDIVIHSELLYTEQMHCIVFCMHTTPYLDDFKPTFNKRVKERMDIIREELMAATWAPKRMAAWCLPYDDEFHSL